MATRKAPSHLHRQSMDKELLKTFFCKGKEEEKDPVEAFRERQERVRRACDSLAETGVHFFEMHLQSLHPLGAGDAFSLADCRFST